MLIISQNRKLYTYLSCAGGQGLWRLVSAYYFAKYKALELLFSKIYTYLSCAGGQGLWRLGACLPQQQVA